MARVLLVLLGLVVLGFGGRALIRTLASDETLIRWEIEAMERGYNSGDVGDAIAPLTKDWVHEGYELNRDLLHAGLVGEFFQDRHPVTKELLRRAELVEDSLEVELTGADAARANAEVVFSRLEQEAWGEAWRARIESDWERREDGWRLVHSRHSDLRGTQLSR